VLMVDEGDIFCRLGGGSETTSSGLELAILGGTSSLLLQICPVSKKALCSQKCNHYLNNTSRSVPLDYLKNHFCPSAW
jgi:hypothetical protein